MGRLRMGQAITIIILLFKSMDAVYLKTLMLFQTTNRHTQYATHKNISNPWYTRYMRCLRMGHFRFGQLTRISDITSNISMFFLSHQQVSPIKIWILLLIYGCIFTTKFRHLVIVPLREVVNVIVFMKSITQHKWEFIVQEMLKVFVIHWSMVSINSSECKDWGGICIGA